MMVQEKCKSSVLTLVARVAQKYALIIDDVDCMHMVDSGIHCL